MKIRQINYAEIEDTEIEDITVTMSLAEAIALVNIVGKLNGHAEQKLQLNFDDSLHDALNGVFIQHYPDGVPDLRIDLATISKADV